MCERKTFVPKGVPVIVATHSLRSALMSVSSQAPARAGTGRGTILVTDAGSSCLEVEGLFSV